MCKCSELYRAIATQALWELYCLGLSPQVRDVIEANGTRSRWWHEFGDEIETALAHLAAAH